MSSHDVDLGLAIRRQSDGQYRSLVLRSPAGRSAEEPFESPFAADEVDGLLRGLATRAMHADGYREIGGGGAAWDGPPPIDQKGVGTALFEALFRGGIREVYHRSIERVRGQVGRRLRLRLLFGLGSGLPAHLASLPWELLYDPDARSFLALDDEIRFIREIDGPRAPERRAVEGRLRFLVVQANGSDQDDLGLHEEWQALQREMASSSAIELVPFDGGSVVHLKETLELDRCFGLHFMGHGRFDPARGRGELLFERNGISQPVSGSRLATNLRNLSDLRWTILNACHSGALANHDDADPLLGVTTALLHGGQAAVVAMQTVVPNTAAIHFSTGFYRALARGESLDAAVYAGRLTVFNELGEDSGAWAIPALFVAPDQSLELPVPPPTKKADEPGHGPPAPPKRPVKAIVAGLLIAALTVTVAIRWWPPQSPPDEGQGVSTHTTADPPDDLPPVQVVGEVTEPTTDLAAKSTKPTVQEPVEVTPPPSLPPPPPPPAIPVSAIVPGKVAVLVLDSTTRAFDREVASAIEAVLWDLDVEGLAPFIPQVDAPFVESLLASDYASLPGDGRAPWGAEYLVVVASRVHPLPIVKQGQVGLLMEATVLLIGDEPPPLVRDRVENTGLGPLRSRALQLASEYCLDRVISMMRES